MSRKVKSIWAEVHFLKEEDAGSVHFPRHRLRFAGLCGGQLFLVVPAWRYFAAYTIKDASLDDMGHVDAGAAKTTWGTFKIVMVSKADGKPVTERGRFTDVSRKANGHWMYAVDHASDDPAPAAH